MSDLSIPGVKSKYDTQKMIEELMKVERIPRDREMSRLKALEAQKAVWLDMNRALATVRESARTLFSFKNPFDDRIATSSNDDALTATAKREALEQTKQLLVKQAAEADRFMSDKLGKDAKVASGDYVFTVGDKTVTLKFGGGTLKEFAEALTKKGGDLIRASIVQVTKDAQTIVIEALKTGSRNRLSFGGAAESWALDSGLVERTTSSRMDLSPTAMAPLDKPLDRTVVKAVESALFVGSGGEAMLPLSRTVSSGGLVLEYEVRATGRNDDATVPTPPPGPAIPSSGSINYQDIIIQSAPSAVDLPSWKPPEKPMRVDDPSMLFLVDGSGRRLPLPPVADSAEFVKVSVRIRDYAADMSAFAVKNRNTSRDVEVRGIRIFDPDETGGMRPKNPVGTARDAIVVMDGIEITRESNAIDDLIPGVTLNVHEKSEKPVKLTVEPDRKAAKDAIIDMVGNYNRVMAEINILSRDDERVLSEIAYFSEDEKKTYKERLGTLLGDITLSQLRSALQRIMMDAYPTRSGTSILAQAGISTNSSGPGGGFDASKMRGYLEIDETALEKALRDNFGKIRDTFGFDSNGDLLADTGVSFKLDALIKPYVETGGILTLKTKTLDQQMAAKKVAIENLDRQLTAKEDELKRKYGMMEGALNEMERSSSALDNFSKQNAP